MKDLNLNAYGVEEMSAVEMTQIDGGFVEFLYKYFTGRDLVDDARALTKEAAAAYAQVIKEGGKTCTDMPFK